MDDTWQVNASRSRFSKALPIPPPKPMDADESRRGKVNPFPSVQRALPPPPKSSVTTTIARRPVGSQNTSSEPSIASVSSTYSASPTTQPTARPLRKESLEAMKTGRTPPLPLKDIGGHRLPDIPQEATHFHTNSSSSAGSVNSSSPKSELWRRRSVKSDRSGSITELKLTQSNGFTASPPSVSASSPLPVAKHSLPPLPTQPARTAVGLPGRDIKPIRPAPSQPDVMGVKASRLLQAESKDTLRGVNGAKFGDTYTESQQSSVKRLPTPEYQSNDTRYQQPLTSKVLSLAAPETPPSDLSPDLTQDNSYLGDYIAGASQPKPRNDLKLLPSVRNTETVKTSTREPSPPRPPEMGKPEIPSSLVVQQPAFPDEAQSDEAPYPDDIINGTPNCFPPAALSLIHFDCYQSHRHMRGSRNDVCPVACMVCEVKDMEKRWTCTWCSLRCCDPCLKGLSNVPGKDLRKCLEWIGRSDKII